MNKEKTFVSCGIDGTICTWDLIQNVSENTENYFEEILINIKELAEKNRNLNHLSSRINEIVAEHSFEIKRLESSYAEKIQLLEQNNSCIVKNLKKRIKVSNFNIYEKSNYCCEARFFFFLIFYEQTLEKEHSMELNRIHLDITQMKQTHTLQMDQLDSNFNNKLLYEFQKYDTLKDEMEKMKITHQK